MDGRPVTIRLLDPPLHEFLPDRTELAVRVATATATGKPDAATRSCSPRWNGCRVKPMLGLRGVRLGLVTPGLFALAGARDRRGDLRAARGGGTPRSRSWSADRVGQGAAPGPRRGGGDHCADRGRAGVGRLEIRIGTMIELPRAALTAHRIADAPTSSPSAPTTDQTTWGFSRDDVEGHPVRRVPGEGRLTVPVRDESTRTASVGSSGSPSRRAAPPSPA